MAQTLDDLDRALAEADSLLGGADDLDSALAEADRLLAAPDPRPSLQGPSRRATPPAAPAPPVAPRASGRPAPAPRAPGLLGVERGGRLTLPGGASATDLAVIQSSPAQMSLRQPDPFARRPQAPAPSDTLGAPDVSLPARAVGGAMNLGQAAIDAVPAGATGFTAGTLGTAASVAGTVASATYAKTPEEARLLSLPAAKARADFAPSPEYSADILDEPGVMLDPRFWGYMTGQLAGSVTSLAGTGAGGRVVGAAAASKLAARAPALASKLARLGGPGAATAGESLVEAADAYQSVLGDGKTPEEAAEAAARVFSANAVLLGLTNHPLFEAGGRGFRQVLKRAVSEGGQEAGQTMAANVATDRPLSEGVGTAALMGAVGGPVAGAILDGPADRAEGPVAPPAQAGAPPAPVPAPPSVADRIRGAIAASEAARKASSFEATPAAAGAPNADLDVVLAEADAVLSAEDSTAPSNPEGVTSSNTPPVVEAAPPATASRGGETEPFEADAYRGARPGAESLPGQFYSPDPAVASEYGDVTRERLRFERPLRADNWQAAKAALSLAPQATMAEIHTAARDAGYDGIVFANHNGKPEFVRLDRPPQQSPAVDIPPPPAQTEPDVAAGSELGEGAGAGGRVPRRRDADFRPQGRAQRAAHLDHVFADVLADARDLDPAVDEAAVRREYDARVELFEELNAEAREAGGDPRDLLREIARLGGIDELDNGKGQHGELQRLREGQGGAVDGIKGVFRRRQYDNRGVPSAGLPLDVMLQRLQQDPRWRNLEDLNDLVDVIDDVQRGNFQRLDLLPGYDRAIRELGMRPGERWWDDPIFPPDAGAVVDETTAEDDLDAAVNEADVVLGETVDDSFNPADFDTVLAEADRVLEEDEGPAPAAPDRKSPAGWRIPEGDATDYRPIGQYALGDRVVLADPRHKYTKAQPLGSKVTIQIVGADPKSANRLEVQFEDGTRKFYNVSMPVAVADQPVADTLDRVAEQQTRLPGEVGAVRDEERAQPRETLPPQSLRLTSESAPADQRSIDDVLREADAVLAEDDILPMAAPSRSGSAVSPMRATQPPVRGKGRGDSLAESQQRAPGSTPLKDVTKGARPSEIVKQMADLLGTPVGVGRLITHRALGYFHPKQNAIRVRVANGLPVLMHEFGHAAERHFALDLKDARWVGEVMRLGDATSRPSYTKKQIRQEGLAEFWRLWVMAPGQAQALAPNFYRAVEGRLDGLGDLGKGLRDLQRRAQAFLDADPAARVALRVDFDGQGTDDVGSWVDRAARHWIDDLHHLRVAVEAMAGGAALPPTLNAYLLARNARGAVNRAADFLDNGVRDEHGQFIGPSLKAALGPVKGKLPEFSVYLVALRARELHGRRIETGLTAAEVEGTIKGIESGPDAAAFAKARDGVYAFQTSILNYAREAGVLSPAAQSAMQKLNQWYVPFQRVMDREAGAGTGRRIADRMSPVKKIKGSGRDIINPLESIIKNAFTFVDTVEKNRAMQALADLADKADERKRAGTGAGRWLRKIHDPQAVTGVKLSDALREAAKRSGALVMTQGGPSIPLELEQVLDDLGIDADQVLPIFQTAFSGPKGQQIVTVLRQGKREFYEIADPMLFDAITQVAPAQKDRGEVLELAQTMAQILRAGATLTVGFIARNPGRDTLTAFLQSRHGFLPVVDTIRGAVKVVLHELGVRPDEDVAQFWAQGITQATLVGTDRPTLRKKIQQLADPAAHRRSVVVNPLELLQALSAFSEVSTRVGEFSLALRQGGEPHTVWQRFLDRNRAPIDPDTLAAATLAARDVTTDFSRAGTASRELNRYAAFFNARVQGYARIVETIRRDPGAVAFNVGALAAVAVIFKMLADDDDDYRELAEWERLTYWHWRPQVAGWKADFFIRIPKPFEWAFIPNAAEAAIDFARERDPEAFNLLKAQIRDNARTLLLGFVPTAIMPAVEATANYSFFRQGPIVSPWDLDLPLEQQAGDWTSATARELTKLGLPIAPAKIDHLLFGHLAGLGRAVVTGVVDPALRLAGVAPAAKTQPAKRWEDMPAIGSLMRSAAPRSDALSIREFYEAFREMEGTRRGYNKAKADPAQQGRILDGVKRQRWRGREEEMKAAKKKIDDLADEIDKVYADPSMTPQQKTTSLEGMRRALVYEARVGLGYESTDHVRRRSPR